MTRPLIIAIDGPASSGKSTLSRLLARELGLLYLDTGSMYRAVALAVTEAGVNLTDEEAVGEVARRAEIMLEGDPDSMRVTLDGRDVTEAIRTPEVTEEASRIATSKAVREAMVAKQRELVSAGDWVAEGRDIGTVVAPDAELKIFLTASPEARARRRALDLGTDWRAVLRDQTLRDEQDQRREHSPLRAHPDAIELDTTDRPPEDVIAQIAGLVAEVRRDPAS
jgi:CMP/dCMP kinase